MDRISVEELQENLEEILDRVEAGESFMITVDGEDKAVILPYADYEDYKELLYQE